MLEHISALLPDGFTATIEGDIASVGYRGRFVDFSVMGETPSDIFQRAIAPAIEALQRG